METNLKKFKFTKKNLKKNYQEAGIYIFRDKLRKPLYIGKSTNLKKRLESYKSIHLSGKTAQMIKETHFFSIIRVSSELEALLLEAHLVRVKQPKYNSQLRDDKHPLYIKITKEEYPQILTARRKDYRKSNAYFFGPFPSSSNVRSVLKMLRRIFPYAQHKVGKRGCIYNQIGLCDPCPSEIEKTKDFVLKESLKSKYRSNIKLVRWVLSGKFKKVRATLHKMMKNYAKKENFEMAKLARDQLEKLDYITQPVTSINFFLKNPNLIEDVRKKEIDELRKILVKKASLDTIKKLIRIECYDIAHLAGFYPTASMVTFINGEVDKSHYRHFRIRQKKAQSDTDSLKELIKRRKKYFKKWGTPNLIIIDGGKPQVSAFLAILGDSKIPIVGFTKRRESIVVPVFEKSSKKIVYKKVRIPKGPALNLIQRLNNEAHRFARRYHHKLLKKELLPNK
jgi:excinuclease UvrABC nuclease subunit